MHNNCVFCDIAAGKIPAKIAYQDDDIVAFWDIHPKAPIHILIITHQHMASVAEAATADAQLLGRLLLVAAQIAETEGLAAGYRLVTNIGAQGGQSVFHLHIHLLGGRRMGWPPG